MRSSSDTIVIRVRGTPRVEAVPSAVARCLYKIELFLGRIPQLEYAVGLDCLYQGKESFLRYLRKDVPLDPWGHPYVYRIPGQHGDYDLLSLGIDGQEGGDGEGTDIVNWK